VQALRRANANSRVATALHEASHAAVGFSFTDWGEITLPFANPMHGGSRCCGGTFDEEVMTDWAGCAMDRVMFRHALYAAHDFYRGYQMLVTNYGHAGAKIRAQALMERTEGIVLELLRPIQALALAAIPRAALAYGDFSREAHRAGLQSGSIRKRLTAWALAAAAVYLEPFAGTPGQLRADLGRDTLLSAYYRITEAHYRTDARSLRIPKCQCGCDGPLLDDDTARWALIEGFTRRLPLPEPYPHHHWRPEYFGPV
jgi:hypothetical protein